VLKSDRFFKKNQKQENETALHNQLKTRKTSLLSKENKAGHKINWT